MKNTELKSTEQAKKAVLDSVKSEPKKLSALKQIEAALNSLSRGIYLF